MELATDREGIKKLMGHGFLFYFKIRERSLVNDSWFPLLNYLKASLIEVGLLLNFGPKVQHIRKIYDNDRKGSLTWIQSKK